MPRSATLHPVAAARASGSGSWQGIQRAGAALLLVLSAGFFALRCSTGADIPFVFSGGDAPWIMPPDPVSAQLHQWGRVRVPVATWG